MSGDAINKKKIVTFVFCLIGVQREEGYRQRSLTLERSAARGSWAARGQHGPPSARPCGAASAAPGAAERGTSTGQGPPGCTWLSPAPPEPTAPAGRLSPPGKRTTAAPEFAGSSLPSDRWWGVCKPFGVGRTAGGATGPGSPGAQVVARSFPAGAAPGA